MPSCKILLKMNIRKTITFALMLFLLPAAASAAQDPDKEEIKVSGQKELYPSVHLFI